MSSNQAILHFPTTFLFQIKHLFSPAGEVKERPRTFLPCHPPPPNPSTILPHLHAIVCTLWGITAQEFKPLCSWFRAMGGWCIDRMTQRRRKGHAGWMWWHLCSFECHTRADQSLLVQSTLTAMCILWCLKTYLFVEAKKLTVAYPTVQYAIDVDVVGLWEKVGTN